MNNNNTANALSVAPLSNNTLTVNGVEYRAVTTYAHSAYVLSVVDTRNDIRVTFPTLNEYGTMEARALIVTPNPLPDYVVSGLIASAVAYENAVYDYTASL